MARQEGRCKTTYRDGVRLCSLCDDVLVCKLAKVDFSDWRRLEVLPCNNFATCEIFPSFNSGPCVTFRFNGIKNCS